MAACSDHQFPCPEKPGYYRRSAGILISGPLDILPETAANCFQRRPYGGRSGNNSVESLSPSETMAGFWRPNL